MKKITRALVWAAAILGLAFASMYDLVGRDAAETLLFVLPILAWLSITDRLGCGPCAAGPQEERA